MIDYFESVEVERCQQYESILNEWYEIINRDLFESCLHPIKINAVPEFFFYDSSSLAQYCIPNDGSTPYMRFNLQGLINLRIEFIESLLEEGWEPTSEDVKEEMKEIIAGTLIHEMIHQYSKENSIEDHEFIDGIDFHTELFKEIAEEKGLLVLTDYNGYSNTHIDSKHPVLNKLQFEDFLEEDYPVWLYTEKNVF